MLSSYNNMNLLKSGFISVSQDDVRVIDSNDLVAEKLGTMQSEASEQEDMASPYELQDFEDDGQEDMAVDALFDEGQDADGAAEDGEQAQTQAKVSAQAKAQADEIIGSAKAQADAILEEARQQANAAAQHAHDQAKQQGHKEGYQEGLIQAQQEIDQKERQLKQMEIELKQKYDGMMEEMEPQLVKALAGAYEHLIGVELSQYKNVLMHLINHTLHSTEASDTYLIHVSEQDFSYVVMQKGQLMGDGSLGSATLEVIEDKTLSKNQCLIETENGIFDCSLSVQLEELKRKLLLLAYSQKGE